jgi:NADH dehydrogenase
VRTSTTVTKVEAGAVDIGETRVTATVVLWAAGVAASPIGRKLGVQVDRAGRVPVSADLSLPGHPEIFVIGDLAEAKDEHGKMLPGVAPVAIQQGRFVAKLIREEVEANARHSSRARPAFHYWDKGSLATIGRAAAVAQFGKIHISGYVAWLSWLFVHILFLIGFRNRLLVFIQWAWSYVTYERGARLITGSTYLPGWTAPSPAPNRASAQAAPQEIRASTRK